MINENYTTNYEVACAILDKLENGGGSTGGNAIYPTRINFKNQADVREIDISGIEFDKVPSLNDFLNGCTNLTRLKGVNNLKNVSNVSEIVNMYSNTPNLIDDGGFHSLPFSEKITNQVGSTFYNCGLPSIDISRWTAKFSGSIGQFLRGASATYINISNQDFGNATTISTTTFDYCYNLEEVKCENTIFPAVNFIYFAASTKLSKQSILDMFNQLPTASATVKIPRHILNNLTEDELLIATNKGWTVNG
jgi:hypothetical protein